MWIQYRNGPWPYYCLFINQELWAIYKDSSKNLNCYLSPDAVENYLKDCWKEVEPPDWAVESAKKSGLLTISNEEEYLQKQMQVLGLSREAFLKLCIRVYQLYQAGELVRLPETLHKRSLV